MKRKQVTLSRERRNKGLLIKDYFRVMQTRLATGYNPASVSIPKRFTAVTTWKGKVDGEFLTELKNAYGQRILKLAQEGV